MKILLFGASGMIGQAVLKEAIADPQVTQILSLVRKPTGVTDPKLTEIARDDFLNYDDLDLHDVDACLFCLGVISSSVTPDAYRVITHDYTLAAATALLAANPDARFLYISGAGTDANSGTLWRKVKGETENALMAMPFRGTFMLRPSFIQPVDGVTSRTPIYRVMYAIIGPVLGPILRLAPGAATTSAALARAMLILGREGTGASVLNTRQINEIVQAG
ncbi:MAG: hypothetical protein Q4G24_16345 [Paracoccus sp. (in: a-proteobacteria)]|uniref:hypothetical protein n=1 Tax=Paracoccus sp. TaxID=267 RepID=UPI0026DF0E9B|nr:hypothetical protein [Paracoccus sp. (in: a-proteobacteria)]MDO5623012.1 hypothetical protein [Paracoccus sp. (in: a-proteobacteria)]